MQPEVLEWVNKGDVCKQIPKYLVEQYKRNGWAMGEKTEKPKPTYSKPSEKRKEKVNE